MVVEQDSLKVLVEMLVLVVDLVTIIMEVFPKHKHLRQLAILLKDMKVEPHIILTKEVVEVVVLVVLDMLVDQMDMVMVDQELLLL